MLEVPAIEIVPPADPGPLDVALAELDQYDWIVLTSPNAVAAVLTRLTVLGLYPRLTEHAKLASVGPATTLALRASFPEDKVTLEPKEYRAEGLVTAFAQRNMAGKRVLLPTSTVARDTLAEGLAATGCRGRRRGGLRDDRAPGPGGRRGALPGAGLRPGALRISFGRRGFRPSRGCPGERPSGGGDRPHDGGHGPWPSGSTSAAWPRPRRWKASSPRPNASSPAPVLDSIPLTRLLFRVWPWTVPDPPGKGVPPPPAGQISRKLEDTSPTHAGDREDPQDRRPRRAP